MGKEVELVLVIASSNPGAVAEKIARLESVAGYTLVQYPVRILQDVYFDTPDGGLKKKRFNLRLRRVDSDFRITLKRSPGLFTLARNEREELELPWSKDSLKRVLEELRSQGVKIAISAYLEGSEPLDVLENTGLVVIQNRKTRREPRDVNSDVGQRSLAELVVDTIEYDFHGQKVGFSEIEIEAKDGGRDILDKIARALQGEFGPELRRWKYGKLMTGKAISKLLDKGELDEFLNNGNLTPAGFDRVNRLLS